MSNKYPKGTAGSIMADYVQRLLKKQQQQGKIQASQIEGAIGYHQMPPGSTGSDPGDTNGGSTTILSTPTGTAGGDVNGTYPSSLVVVGIHGHIVDDITPPDGGILVYETDTGHWVPAAAPTTTVSNEQIDDRVAAFIVAGTGITSTYNDTANTLTIAAVPGITGEDVDDRVNALIVAGSGITKTYNDVLNTLTLSTTGGLTNEDVDDRVNALIIAGNGITKLYDDVANTLTLVATGLTNPMLARGDMIVGAAGTRVNQATPADGAAATSIDTASTFVPANIIDGSDSTYALTTTQTHAQPWYRITFSTAKAIGAHRLLQATGNPGVSVYKLQASNDGTSWTDVYTSPSNFNVGSGDSGERSFPEVSARHWRFQAVSGPGGNGWQVYTAELYGPGTSAGDPARLPIGSNGHVLTSNGSTPTWAVPAGGGGGISAEEVDDRVSDLIVAGEGIIKTYDDAANTLTLSVDAGDVPRIINAAYLENPVVGIDVGPNITLDADATAVAALLFCKVAPFGGPLTIDLLRTQNNGSTWTSLFSTRPTIAAGARSGGDGAVFAITDLLADDVFRIDVTTVGTTAPVGVTIQLAVTSAGGFVGGGGDGGGITLEEVDDRVATLIVAGTGISKTYDDAANTLTLASTVVGGDGGMENPMTAAGDIIIGGNTAQVNQATPAMSAVATAIDTWLGYIPANLIDGSDATVAESQTHLSGHPWFRVDLGSAKAIAAFRVLQAIGGHGASVYKIQTSPDNTVWTDVYTSPANRNTGTGDSGVVAITETTARYWRLYLETYTTSSGGWQVSTWELLAPGLPAGNPQRLAVGSNGHVLTSNGSVPVWQAAASGTDTHTVGPTAPTSPMPGDIWLDISGDIVDPSDTIITSGLILGYAMDEGSGQTLNDLSAGNYDAVLGSTSSVSSDDPDWVTQGLDFNRADNNVVTAAGVPDTAWLGPTTIMVVAKLDDGSNYHQFVCKHAGNGSSANPCDFRTDSGGTPKLSLNRGNTGTRTYEGPAVSVGAYRCYSFTVGPNITAVPTFYVGTTPTTGVPVGITPGTDAPPTGSSQPVLIGRRADGVVELDGVMSYVLVYNRVLSAGEIATNYAALQAIMTGRGVTLP